MAGAYGVLVPVVDIPKRWTFYIGADGKILHVDKDVNASTAGEDMVARLEALGIPKRGAGESGA